MMIDKRPATSSDKVIVRFEVPGTIWTERINLVGDFNNWDRESLPFRRNRGGNWHIELELDAGDEYRFCYLLDGVHWRYDWHADKYAPNPHGGYDSIVVAAILNSTASSEMWHDLAGPARITRM
jgi:1,4-alpha-glucan branching enzyme